MQQLPWKEDYFSTCSGEFDLLYRAYKPPTGRAIGTLVIVHGFGEHSERYAYVAHALIKAGFNVLLFDLPGHGHSAGIRGHIDAFEQYVSATKSAVDKACQLFHSKAVMLLGHSMGGLICMHYAVSSSSNLLGLILTSPLCGLSQHVPVWKQITVDALSCMWPTSSFPIVLPSKNLTHDYNLMQAHKTDPLRVDGASFCCLSQLKRAMQACKNLVKNMA